MKKALLILIFIASWSAISRAQQKITLEDIFEKGTFSTQSVPGFNFMKDGRHYSRQEGLQVREYDLLSGDFTRVIFNASEFTAQTEFPGSF